MSAQQHATPPLQPHSAPFFGMLSGSPFTTPPVFYGEVALEASGPQPNYKTRACRHFDAGKCKLGGLCNFAHGDAELKLYRRRAHEGVGAGAPSGPGLPAQPPTPNKQQLLGNASKIAYLEDCLESFYETQKNLLEHVKFLSLDISSGRVDARKNSFAFNNSPQSQSDEQILAMEGHIANLYNSSVNYVQILNSVLDAGGDEGTSAPRERVEQLERLETLEAFVEGRALGSPNTQPPVETDDSRLSDFLSGSGEDELASMKLQMHFILHQLSELHLSASPPTFPHIAKLLKEAARVLKRGKVVESAQKLQLVLYDPSIGSSLKKRHLEIVEEAKSFL